MINISVLSIGSCVACMHKDQKILISFLHLKFNIAL